MVNGKIVKNYKFINWNKDFLIILFLFFFSVLLRLYNYAELPILTDEIYVSEYAFSILSHNWSWPVEFMGLQPPLLPYIFATITYLFGGNFETLRIISILFGSLTSCIIYLLGKELFGRQVGLLSGILLSLSSYHILFSKVLMMEATVIFFILTTLYFLWMSFYSKDQIKCACLSGIFLGLSINTKYIGFLLYPGLILFILWTRRTWTALIEKKVILIFSISFLVISPVLMDLYIHDINPILRYSGGVTGNVPATSVSFKTFPFIELLTKGFENYVNVLTDRYSPASLSLPWLSTFQLAASLLLMATILYHLYLALKTRPSESFIFIFFAVFNIFVALYKKRYEYYLLWALPLFFIMLSNMTTKFTEKIFSQRRLRFADFIRILIIFSASIFIISYFIVGTMAPSVNKGPKNAYEVQIINIKNKIQPGDTIATNYPGVIKYYLDKHDFNILENDIYVLPLYKKKKKRTGFTIFEVDIEMLKIVEPRFIITSTYYHAAYAGIRENEVIRENYILISELISGDDEVLLYERKS